MRLVFLAQLFRVRLQLKFKNLGMHLIPRPQ
jgi:hypothetical protein